MLEEHISPFLEFLKQQHYARMSIQLCRVATTEFVIYLGGRVARPEDITVDHLRGYLGIRADIFPHFWKRPMLPDYQERLASALTLFLRYLESYGILTQIALPKPKDLSAVPGYEDTLSSYHHFLIHDRGLSPGTVKTYLDHAARLCQKLVHLDRPPWETVSAKVIYDHLRAQAKALGHVALCNAQTALRSFFRFLHITNRCQKNLDVLLIRRRAYSLAKVPKTVSLDQLQVVFDDVQGTSPYAIRDRAVLLLLTVYGLRVGEVVRLAMDDVRWREQQLIIRRRKAGRDLILPLQPPVAHALLEYVEQVRPRGTPYREVFLTKRVPRPFLRGSNLAMTLRERMHKLGLKINPHALRHTLASQLINNDCPPEWIQQLLGHAQFRSTQIYTKVDMAHLREVADNDAMDVS